MKNQKKKLKKEKVITEYCNNNKDIRTHLITIVNDALELNGLDSVEYIVSINDLGLTIGFQDKFEMTAEEIRNNHK